MSRKNKNDILSSLLEEMQKTNRILRIAFRKELSETLAGFTSDPISKEILDCIKTRKETAVNLKRDLSKKLGVSGKTIERRLAEMVSAGVLIEIPQGKTFVYSDAKLC